MITIDGVVWSVPCKIVRTAEIKPSQISGLMLDKSWFNDVIGTYMSYTVTLAVPVTLRDLYAQIYEILTDPVDGHTFVLPYNSSTVTVTGRVQTVKDTLARFPGDVNHWKGITFTVIANHPTKSKTLAEIETRGRTVVPEVAEHNEGDTWVWTNGGWALSVSYTNADNKRY